MSQLSEAEISGNDDLVRELLVKLRNRDLFLPKSCASTLMQDQGILEHGRGARKLLALDDPSLRIHWFLTTLTTVERSGRKNL
jgi:hypothetical protein